MRNKKSDKQQSVPGDFEIEDIGRTYSLPTFRVEKEKGLVQAEWDLKIAFVRGSTDPEEKVQGFEGVTHESLLEMQIADIRHKDKLVPSEENKVVIKKLKEALMWLRDRQHRRKKEGTKGTYKE